MQNILMSERAVAGQGAALGMGLLMLGQGPRADAEVREMLAYAQETKHEKIIRGLAMALAFTMYGQEEGADTLVEQVCALKKSNT
jgi:26S proteasome regulatory subunit N2